MTGQDVPVAESGAVPVSGGTQDVYASPDTLSADRAGDRRPFGWLVVLELLALVLLPGLLAAGLRRRMAARGAAR
ncbi:hypothetical protein [Nocardioides humi]|uniref:hypothetical protein n=1 Tax=Nocardioides humi TaxID=449461 RepID=UPI0015E858CA|nr:hypothetical protein [Nocardioides humi]